MGSWERCGDSVRRSFKRFLDKTLENLGSLKFYAICLASYLKVKGDLDSDIWFYTVALCVLSRDTLKMIFSSLEVLQSIKGMKYGSKDLTQQPQAKEVPREIAD